MRKNYTLFSFIISILFSNSVFSQTIINGNFDTWQNISFEKLTDWDNSNGENLDLFGVPNVTKVSDKVSGNFAIKLETMLNAADTGLAYIANGNPNEPPGQGIPFSTQVTHIKGYYKSNIIGTDFSLLWIIFKKNGSVIKDTLFYFTGVQSTYTAFSYGLNLSQKPDSVIIAAASSDPFMGNIKHGSWIQLDSLTFDSMGTKHSIPNGNFENWTNISIDYPPGWNTENFRTVPHGAYHAEKTTDKYAGPYAAKITTLQWEPPYLLTQISNGKNSQSGWYGGIPYTLTKDTLTGYYKYFPQGSDSGVINIHLTKNHVYIGYGSTFLPPTGNSYVYFEIPFAASQTPDTLRIDISSSKSPYDQSNVGSALFIDELMLKSDLPVLVKNRSVPFRNSLYPVPAKDFVTSDVHLETGCDVHLSIYDITGKVVYQTVHKDMAAGNHQFRISTQSMAPGVYIYQLTAGDKRLTTKFTVEH